MKDCTTGINLLDPKKRCNFNRNNKIKKMKRSKFFNLNFRDFIKGLFIAVLSAAITFVYEAVQTGLSFDAEFFKAIGIVSLTTFLAYLSKNLFENSDGAIAKEK